MIGRLFAKIAKYTPILFRVIWKRQLVSVLKYRLTRYLMRHYRKRGIGKRIALAPGDCLYLNVAGGGQS